MCSTCQCYYGAILNNMRILLHYIVSRGNTALVLDCLPVVNDVNQLQQNTLAYYSLTISAI